MLLYSERAWNIATLIVGVYGIGLIVLSALVRGFMVGRGLSGYLGTPTNHDAPTSADLPFAFGAWSLRFIALLLDVGVLCALAAAPALLIHPAAGALLLCVAATIYFPIAYGYGGTVGTVITGLRIVTASGRRPGFARGVLRYLMFFNTMLPIGGRTAAIRGPGGVSYDPKTMQGGHDRLAGTYVVSTRDQS